MSEVWRPDVVIYHDPCLDGFTAAWACWLRWPDADYIGCNYGQSVPEVSGKNVLIVDFSFKAPLLEQMAQSAASIVILDHHKSARLDLEHFQRFADNPDRFTLATVHSMIGDLQRGGYPAVCALFDMERSGARLAWEFAHPEKETPWLVRLVEDRDLWKFAYQDTTRDFHVRLAVEEKIFDRWSMIDKALAWAGDGLGIDAAQPVIDGAAMRKYRDWLVRQVAGRAEIRPIAEHHVPVVDCPYEIASEVGDWLCTYWSSYPFVALRTHSVDGTSFSLRSRGGFDVSKIAEKFGGGGHAAAAGFRVPPAV